MCPYCLDEARMVGTPHPTLKNEELRPDDHRFYTCTVCQDNRTIVLDEDDEKLELEEIEFNEFEDLDRGDEDEDFDESE